MGILISVPIAIIYNLLVSKIINILTVDYAQKDRIQKELLISVIAGVVAIAIGFIVFGNEQIENKIVKYGLILGGGILLFYSTIYNWNTLEDLTKVLFLLGTLVVVILFSYKWLYDKKNEKKKKKTKKE